MKIQEKYKNNKIKKKKKTKKGKNIINNLKGENKQKLNLCSEITN